MLCDMRKRIQGAIMRCLFVALGLAGMIFDAVAADLPTLRGSDAVEAAYPVYPRWQGSYIGGQVGYSHSHVDYSTFSPMDFNAGNYGAFIGYNTQWDSVIIGFEANYSRTSLNGLSTLSSGSVVTTNWLKITDYGTLRARAGFILYDCILPYAMIGGAVGFAKTSSITVDSSSSTLPPTTVGGQGGHVIWGFSVGAGVEVALSPAIFVRAEYEYVQFAFNPISANVNSGQTGCVGSQCISPAINTIRAAVGFRF
jgi:outer membrane immunogenic protein